ncbi:DNA-3-methyladenine glycosylase [Virgibacillus sp. MSJ-26]|uniref:DNA-3-methyladenine glycosylase n=1 Tax=Virgibacillus sp. MSJ-26 TaxID=2841522 RepID=UPI001C108B0B|nr:DNA-3-methyladenine glycosylase [Virgibacillus sp. MSJ-26]MBU5467182.1 DNA-3-methyladenine glycosylase [Virgibacillus sp. MSJ-26]
MQSNYEFQPLKPSFYDQSTLQLAESLLGQVLVKETDEGTASGIIVETEAYLGEGDQAAHSYKKRRTKRTEIMFQAPGHAYIYQMHTHRLVNIVSGEEGNPQAVLIRAVEPLAGIELMKKRRPVDKMTNLTSGPGKLTKALGITMEDYGRKLFEPPLFIAKGKPSGEIVRGTRIGIDNSGEARDYPYRFWVKGNPYVSR